MIRKWDSCWNDIMSIISQIAKGTVNNLLNKEDELYQKRIKMCRSCKLFKQDKIFGEICNPSLYVNPKTEETSRVFKSGFIHGCGCVLRSKTRVKEAECPLDR